MQCNSSPFYMHRPKLWKGGRLWLQDNCENHHDITWCQRILVFPPKRVEDTRQGQVVDIMAGHVFVWTRLTKPGETCIYQTRVFFCHNLRTWTGVYIYYFEIEVQSPNPNLSITPGLNGSMRTSAEPQSFLRTFTPDNSMIKWYRSKEIHTLRLFQVERDGAFSTGGHVIVEATTNLGTDDQTHWKCFELPPCPLGSLLHHSQQEPCHKQEQGPTQPAQPPWARGEPCYA